MVAVVITLIYILSFVKIGDSTFIKTFFKQITLKDSVWQFVITLLFLISFCFTLFFLIRFFNRLKINKLGFQFADIELTGEKDDSLLNKYLDEVLYFFETTKCDVVIFEDLDRFKNTEIFTNLRELNTLINNYENVKQKVVFIYALRDDVFEDKTRTKFFEFIIPIIPVINIQNSGDILIKKREELQSTAFLNLDEYFLYDVGLYIDDMRLLLNCINEFFIYDSKINGNVSKKIKYDRNKIFALILYKNLYPEDFAQLSYAKGFLYEILSMRQTLIKESKQKIKEEKEELYKLLSDKKEQHIKDIKQLRLLYVAEILNNSSIYTNSRPSQYIDDDKFEAIKKETNLSVKNYVHLGYNVSASTTSIPYDFSEIEKRIDPELTYDEKVALIKTSEKEICDEIKKKDKEIEKLNKLSFTELANSNISFNQTLEDYAKRLHCENFNLDFISYLVRTGKIDENYFDYISYFYEGSISAKDKEFLLLVKNRAEPKFDIELDKKEHIVKRLVDNDWFEPAILNNSLLHYLLDEKDKKLDKFLETMFEYDLGHSTVQFFKQYECSYNNQDFFYQSVYDNTKNSKGWVSVLFDESMMEKFFHFFMNVDVASDDITYKEFIQNHILFLYKNFNEKELEQIENKLKKYVPKINFEKEIMDFPIFDIIIKNNFYKLSKHNLDFLIKKETLVNEEKEITDFLTQIKKISDKNVEDYVYANIYSVVEKILIPLGENLSESEEIFINLLNSSEIDLDKKKHLIQLNQNKMSDITRIDCQEAPSDETETTTVPPALWTELLKNNKVLPSWNNVLAYFEKIGGNDFDEILLNWLNGNHENILDTELQLSEKEIDDKESERYKLVSSFYSSVLRDDNVEVNAFKAFMGVCPWVYKGLAEYDIENEKMKFLIDKRKLTFTQENFTGIKSEANALLPLFLHIYFDDFLKGDAEYIELEDLFDCLKSDLLISDEKIKILSTKFLVWEQLEKDEDLQFIGKKIIELKIAEKLPLPIKDIAVALLWNGSEIVVDFMILQSNSFNETAITEILSRCDNNYSKLVIKNGRHSNLEKTETNRKLLEILKNNNIISSYREKNSKFVVIHKRK